MVSDTDIAIIGMAGRFPGAPDIAQFWKNLEAGVESIRFFSRDELQNAGVTSDLLSQPNYVRANGLLEGIEEFSAEFFDLSSRESELMDPQHRLFLECAWETMEMAGYGGEQTVAVGCFAGASINTYLLKNLRNGLDEQDSAAVYQATIGNDKDYLCTRVAYKLNLKGPALTIQTGCSSSLVAVHMACQSLLNGECSMALAGGVSILVPQEAGYLRQEGMILSSDGHCRAFDSKADGTISGNGLGLVLLKRAEDAIRDNDSIYALIKGSAINNDGSAKIGYTSPSVEGQAQVIQKALAVSGVNPESISFVEAHGTGTSIGDPIEIAALTQAFSRKTSMRQYCALGAVKTNIGHLDAAAGVAGLIKTVLALNNKKIPGTLHFDEPNPVMELANTPFKISRSLQDWPSNGVPRRAGVSSFGIGGTNAHVILEESPVIVSKPCACNTFLFVLSAKSRDSLQSMGDHLKTHLLQNPLVSLDDVTYTLQVGRRSFDYRYWFVADSISTAVTELGKLALANIQPCSEQSVPFQNYPADWGNDKAQLEVVGQSWAQGSNIRWNRFYQAPFPRRVALPTYPFSRQKYWVSPTPLKMSEARNPISEWGYYRSWIQRQLPEAATTKTSTAIFSSGKDWGLAVAERLRLRGVDCQIIESMDGHSWTKSLANPRDTLHILYFAGFVACESDPLDDYFNLVRLYKTFEGLERSILLTLVTRDYFDVTGCEVLRLADSLLAGLIRVMPMEFPQVQTRHIDLSPSGEGYQSETLELIADGLFLEPADSVVAYRNGKRWEQCFEPLILREPTSTFKKNGVYLLIGGLGDLGFGLAKHLALATHAKLVIIGRSPASEKKTEERVQQLKINGADAHYLSADVTEENSLRAAVAIAESRFGSLSGVFFSPGIRDLRLIKDCSDNDCRKQIELRQTGLLTLERVLEGKPLEFCFVVSSLSSVLGAAGFGAYSAAHAFVDQFVQIHNRQNRQIWNSANFDNWITEQEERQDKLSIRSSEGVELILRILSQRNRQVVISTTNLQSRFVQALNKKEPVSKSFHERPALENPFAQPRTESERKLIAIWERLLGVKPIGLHDNFFDLGGDSIISIQILSAARAEGIEIGSQSILVHPTVSELLAQCASSPAQSCEQGILRGPAPLLPAQAWFFNLPFRDRNHFNHFVTLETSAPRGVVEAGIQGLLIRHDALRLRFMQNGNSWSAVFREPDERFECIAFRIAGSNEELIAVMNAKIEQAQSGLNIASGHLVKGLWFESADERTWFTLIIHHLAVDGFSWSILLSDLSQFCQQIIRGEELTEARKTASQRDWWSALQEQLPDIRSELPDWSRLARSWKALPLDTDGPDNSYAACESVVTKLDNDETEAFELNTRRRFGATPDAVILAAIAIALLEWSQSATIQIDCEGLGRGGDVDLSRTVGWFTDLYPVSLAPANRGNVLHETVDDLIREIHRGKSLTHHFGTLRYLDDASAAVLQSIPRSEVIFVFLGRLANRNTTSEILSRASWGSGFSQDKAELRTHLFEFEAQIVQDQLQVKLEFSMLKHHRATATKLVERLSTILRELSRTHDNSQKPGPDLTLSEAELALLLDDTN